MSNELVLIVSLVCIYAAVVLFVIADPKSFLAVTEYFFRAFPNQMVSADIKHLYDTIDYYKSCICIIDKKIFPNPLTNPQKTV